MLWLKMCWVKPTLKGPERGGRWIVAAVASREVRRRDCVVGRGLKGMFLSCLLWLVVCATV